MGRSSWIASIMSSTGKNLRPTEQVEALSISASSKTTVTFTCSQSDLGVHSISLMNTGDEPCYFMLSTDSKPVSSATADTALAAAASSGLSSRCYLPANGAWSGTFTDRIRVLYLLCATGAKTTNVYGVVTES